jgi:tetrahydromethanopterin S-methyltransferase subunit F
VKDKKSVFYLSSFVIIVSTVLFISFEVDSTDSQRQSVESNLILSNTTATDAIDRTVNGIATSNLDRLMSETILPVLTNSSTSKIVISGNNQTSEGTEASGLSSINSSGVVSNDQNPKGTQVQNNSLATNIGGKNSNNGSELFMMDPELRASKDSNARALADNGTILLQLQNPTDTDIVNRLQKIETILQDYTTRNDVNSTSKSIEESNNQIINQLSAIKSSIIRSSALPAVTDLDSTARSIEESNNQIINQLSAIKSSNLWSGITSGALAAGIVSAVAVFVLTRLYGDSRIKLGEMRLRRRNNSNYT